MGANHSKTAAEAIQGNKAESAAFPAWPFHGEDEIAAVVAVLRSGKVNAWTGPNVGLFEREFANSMGAPYSIALSNGTVALELALRGLGIGSGDEVIVPAAGFIADATCPIMVGAVPVFADVDVESQTLSAESAAACITDRTRAIIAVHLGGMPCDMAPILALADEHKLFVIEDCAQAHGARYKGRQVGSMGDAAAISFCNDKILSTGGEGGMLLFQQKAHWQSAWSYKDHGKGPSCLATPALPGPYRFVHDEVGSNYRMTEMQAAIGRVQLGKLDMWLRIRKDNALLLLAGLSKIGGIRVPLVPDACDPSWYKAYAFIEPELITEDWSRDRIIRAINKAGVPSGSGGCPELYREQAIVALGLAQNAVCPVANNLGETSLCFRVDPALGNAQIDRTVNVVREVMAMAVKN